MCAWTVFPCAHSPDCFACGDGWEGAVLPPERALGVLVSWKLGLRCVHGLETFLGLCRKGAQNPVAAFALGAREPAELVLSKGCLQALLCAARGPLLLPWLMLCLLCLGTKQGHPRRRTAFRAVCLIVGTLPASALLLE